MSAKGYLICRTCKQQVFLGQWLHDEDDVGYGFAGGTDCTELGLKVLNFLARHINHQVQILSHIEYDKLELTEPLYEYREMRDELRADWPARLKRG